ncbi:MAG: hypothetical protein IPM06_20230 [Rhizobiales bacterium]|nr:hypothetical protein [Hyphomicrobiales bacterium]
MLRRTVHAVLVLLAVIPWVIGLAGFGVALLLVLLADWAWPKATWGNCWSFVGPRWFKHGGYICARPADGVRLLGKFWIPHAFWMPEIGADASIQQTVPDHRSNAQWLPWRVLYFPYRVIRKERAHNSNWADL